MIVTKTIFDKANQIIDADNLNKNQINQLASIEKTLDNIPQKKVTYLSDLPEASDNKGIIYYVESAGRPYFSDGFLWRTDFTSDYEVQNTIIYAWGYNTSGQLGDGTTSNRSSPVTVVGGITNWRQISAGEFHGLGLTSSGVVYAWGRNNNGNLGDGTTTSRSSPVTVIGGITDWKQVNAGRYLSLGLTYSGVIYGWGRNTDGQLGDGTLQNKSSPVTVVGGITNWNKISTSGYTSLGLTSKGILYSWGRNLQGELGDNTTSRRSSPVTVVGGITNWKQISTGSAHVLGLTATGLLYSWGSNSSGRLGDNTASSRSSPVTVVGGITNWVDISSGNHSLGLTTSGVLYSWGPAISGQLGDNSITARSSPVTVVGGITNWSQISAADDHSLGLRSTGVLYSWGDNTDGQLGDNTTSNRSSPVTVVGGITNWSQISAGGSPVGEFSFALRVNTQVTKGFI